MTDLPDDRAAMRASHQDRDRIADMIREAAGDGRLTAEELDQRLEAALTAQTYGELVPLVADLPASQRPGSGGVLGDSGVLARPAEPAELVTLETRSGVIVRDGRWVVPKRIRVNVRSGTAMLDLTEAVLTGPVLRIEAEVRSGVLRLITRPGITVDTAEVATRSGTTKVTAPWGNREPEVLRIEVTGQVRSGAVSAGPRWLRRTFWQWLTRAPRRYQGQPGVPGVLDQPGRPRLG